MKSIIKIFFVLLFFIPFNLLAEPEKGNVVEKDESVIVSNISDLTLQAAHTKDEYNKLSLKLKRYSEILKEHENSYERIRKEYEVFQEQRGLLDERQQFISTDRISDLMSELEQNIEDCGEIISEQASMIKSLADYRKEWANIEANWKEWIKQFRNNKDIVDSLYKEVKVDILQVESEITPLENALLNNQTEFAKIQVTLKEQKKLLSKTLHEYKNDILLKTADSFFSLDFWKSLKSDELFKTIEPLAELLPSKNFSNLTSAHCMVFFLHILLFVIFFIVIKRLKKKSIDQDKMHKLISLPVATAFMLSSFIVLPHYGTSLPPLFQVIIIFSLSLSAIFLINAFIKLKWNRVFLDVLLISYAVSKLLSIINFSEIIVRLSLIVFPLLIISLLIKRMFLTPKNTNLLNVVSEDKQENIKKNQTEANKQNCAVSDSDTKEENKRFSFGYLLFGVALLLVFIVVLIAQILGYFSLSLYIFDATIRSVFCLVSAWLFCSLIKGMLHAILNYSFLSRSKLIKGNSEYIISKLNILICCVVTFFTISFILYSWRLFDSSKKASKFILSLGFPFNDLTISLGKIFLAVFLFGAIISFSWLLCQFLNLEVYPKKGIQIGVRAAFNRIIQYSFFFIAVLVGLISLGFNLQNLAVAFGALGIGIGFGLQNIVNNFASGIILLFERPIKVGDVIEVNSQLAVVKKLGLRATVVETYNKAEVIVPNSVLASEKVTNLTLTNRMLRSVIQIGVAYNSDVEEVTNILKNIALNHELVLKSPEPTVLFTEFGDSALQFELYFWSSFDDRLKIKHDLDVEIIKTFREKNIEIPFPQRNLIIEGLENLLSKNKESK